MLKLGKYQYGGYDNELNIYGHFGNRHDGDLDYGVRGAFEISKKQEEKENSHRKLIVLMSAGMLFTIPIVVSFIQNIPF